MLIATSIISILVTLSTIYGVISLFVEPRTFVHSLIDARKRRLEYNKSLKFLKINDYFICHVIQLGGLDSSIHSIQLTSYEEGGYYLNPPEKFVNIGMNRAGVMIITPTKLTTEAGFYIDSYAKAYSAPEEFIKTQNKDIFHLPTENEIKK